MSWEEVWEVLKNWLLNTGIRLVISIIVLFVSFKLINFLSRRTLKRIEKRSAAKTKNFDKTIANTFAYAIRIALKVLIILAIVAYLGFDVSAITAVIASTGVGVGLAINGALSNLAGGILLLVTRPFKEDDYISANGFDGTVEHIRLCHTVIRTPDNKVVYLPNGTLSSSTVTNYSVKDVRRVDMNFSIGYEADYEKAKRVIGEIFDKHELILKDPSPMVRVSEHGESSINLVARCWTKNGDYWTVKFDVTEAVKTAFDENGISIPYPQLDVHMKND